VLDGVEEADQVERVVGEGQRIGVAVDNRHAAAFARELAELLAQLETAGPAVASQSAQQAASAAANLEHFEIVSRTEVLVQQLEEDRPPTPKPEMRLFERRELLVGGRIHGVSLASSCARR
jgi:antitoxin component of MazEF toxin-antitoxin module